MFQASHNNYLLGLCIMQIPISHSLIILDCKQCTQCQEDISQTLGVKGDIN